MKNNIVRVGGYPPAERVYRDFHNGAYTTIALDSVGVVLRSENGKIRPYIIATRETYVESDGMSVPREDVVVLPCDQAIHGFMSKLVEELKDGFTDLDNGVVDDQWTI